MAEHAPHHAHSHEPAPARAVARAEHLCAERGVKLTPMRAQVLSLLAASQQPLGAYDLIEKIGSEGDRPAPITVYRALDFLLGQGLAHRIESKNAFVACDHAHSHADVVVFLLCERCGAAVEASGADVGANIAALAADAGFVPRGQFVEVAGECAACRATQT
ncbi:transcriptional repressor [Flaviflagellibacter deserti]|jgi:Fur family transcriptional regulator, zinc uptake regulator|uniref:Transcriptional repressor n=1 Tax=Flaviflagellibacter deserti TaxID=2267266 RepID=A0ABV9Z6X5_9HYPH